MEKYYMLDNTVIIDLACDSSALKLSQSLNAKLVRSLDEAKSVFNPGYSGTILVNQSSEISVYWNEICRILNKNEIEANIFEISDKNLDYALSYFKSENKNFLSKKIIFLGDNFSNNTLYEMVLDGQVFQSLSLELKFRETLDDFYKQIQEESPEFDLMVIDYQFETSETKKIVSKLKEIKNVFSKPIVLITDLSFLEENYLKQRLRRNYLKQGFDYVLPFGNDSKFLQYLILYIFMNPEQKTDREILFEDFKISEDHIEYFERGFDYVIDYAGDMENFNETVLNILADQAGKKNCNTFFKNFILWIKKEKMDLSIFEKCALELY